MMTDGVWVLVNSELNSSYYTWIENRPNKSFKYTSPLKTGHFEWTFFVTFISGRKKIIIVKNSFADLSYTAATGTLV